MVNIESDFLTPFLEANPTLVVDANSGARTSLIGSLSQLGAKRHRILTAGSIAEAKDEIRRNKPKLIFCDFMVGKESGLDLIQEQKIGFGEDAKDCLFVLVTGNASQSTVARAAEEDVDTFVIKPYNLNVFRKCLNDAIAAKLNPSDYSKKIELGKSALSLGAIEEASTRFEEAKKLSDQPTLACFYLGQTDAMKSLLEDAAGSFREGLAYNKIHFKCLVGLYELMMKEKRYGAAYDVVKKLAQYFPANPKRLATVLRLAVVTSNFDDIEGYYRLFTLLDERSDELIRYACSALAVTGKYYLSRNTRSRAFELFDYIAASCAGRIQYMRHAVESMVRYEQIKQASEYLERFPAEVRGRPDFQVASLVVAGAMRPTGEVIQQARGLLQSGVELPSVYLVLIKHSRLAGLNDSVESLVQQGTKKWPDRAEDFAFAQKISTRSP